MKRMLDQAMVDQGLARTRTQANSLIKLGLVKVNQNIASRADFQIGETDIIRLLVSEQYVSRAALKLASVAKILKLDFRDKVVLDVGSSTGGFTDFALQHGASKVIAVEVGSDQLHSDLRGDKRIELHEQTDIRNVRKLSAGVDLILIDVSFVSLRDILPSVSLLANQTTQILAMFKPQFEAGDSHKNKGIVKNDKLRRGSMHDFEDWLRLSAFTVIDKADSKIAGAMGNQERFYLLKLVRSH